MNRIFYPPPFLNKFGIVFIDNILAYTHNGEKHEEHQKVVWGDLKEKRLYAKLSKLEFWSEKVLTMFGNQYRQEYSVPPRVKMAKIIFHSSCPTFGLTYLQTSCNMTSSNRFSNKLMSFIDMSHRL
ncbi:hypothetical protein CR513_15583, partial [Mucuna pruriens]